MIDLLFSKNPIVGFFSTYAKGIVVFVIAAMLASAVYKAYSWYSEKNTAIQTLSAENKKLTEEVGVKKAQIAQLTTSLQEANQTNLILIQARKIDHETIDALLVENKKIASRHTSETIKVITRIEKIRQDSSLSPEQKHLQESTEIIDSIWQGHCAIDPSLPACSSSTLTIGENHDHNQDAQATIPEPDLHATDGVSAYPDTAGSSSDHSDQDSSITSADSVGQSLPSSPDAG